MTLNNLRLDRDQLPIPSFSLQYQPYLIHVCEIARKVIKGMELAETECLKAGRHFPKCKEGFEETSKPSFCATFRT